MKMKKLFLTLITVLLFCILTNAQERLDLKQLYNTEWQYNEASVTIAQEKVYKQLLEDALKAGNKKELKSLKKNKKEVISQLNSLISSVTFRFSKDKKVFIKVGNETNKEDWSFDAATNTITSVNKLSGRKNVITIKLLTKSKVIYIDEEGNEMTYLALDAFNPLKFSEDLEDYKTIVESAHSGMYLYTPKTVFDSLFVDAQSKIPALKSTREFYNLIANIHTQINCGHSSFYPSGDIFSEVKDNSENAFFPFKVKFLKDMLVVAEDYKTLKKGDQINSINEFSIKDITDKAFRLISSDGYNETFKYRQLEDDFSTIFFLAFGPKETYSINFSAYSGNTNATIELDGIPQSKLNNTVTESHFSKPYYLDYIDVTTAQLTVNTFSTETPKNQKKFFKFLEESFKEINRKGIQNLIVDIRNNTGGDDGNDMELASYFINSNFKENKFRKLNSLDNLPPLPEYLNPSWFEMFGVNPETSSEEIQKMFKEMAQEETIKENDGTYYWKEEAVIKRSPAKHRFKGNVYVLTSGMVFSGGGLFSALVRDKSDAVFIGEETGGGYYRHTGTIPLTYKLPNSGLIFSIFIVINEQDVNQKLVPKGRGTIPQYEVHQTVDEYVNNKDAVIQKALNLIKNKD